MRLLRVEVLRFWKRRLVRALVLVVAAGVVVYGATMFVGHTSEKPSRPAISAQAERQAADCRQNVTNNYHSIVESITEERDDAGLSEFLAEYPTAEAFAAEQCNPIHFGPRVTDERFCLADIWTVRSTFSRVCPDVADEFLPDSGLIETSDDAKTRFVIRIGDRSFKSQREANSGPVTQFSVGLLVLSVVLGAGFIGSEYRAGTIETQLLWEPRRLRVLGAKLAAAGTGAFVIHVALLVLLVVAVLPAAWLRGTTAGADQAFWSGLSWTILRGGVVAAFAAAIAAGVTTVARYTTAAIVLLLGYNILSPLLVHTTYRWLRPRDLIENTLAFATYGDVGRYVRGGQFEGWISVASHGPINALAHLALYTAVVTVIAAAIFQRRDIK